MSTVERALLAPPRALLRVAGQTLPEAASRALAAVYVRRALGVPARCELRFDAPQGGAGLAVAFTPGAALEVDLERAEGGAPLELFRGDIAGVEERFGPRGATELRVRAYDALARLRRQQRLQVFENVDAAALARELLRSEGIEVAASPGGGPRWPRLLHHYPDDLALLRAVAALEGRYPTLRRGRLELLSLAGDGAETVLRWGRELIEARIDRNLEAAAARVQVHAWSTDRARSHAPQVDAPEVGLAPTARYALLGALLPSAEHARGAAGAHAAQRSAHAARFWGVTGGHPDLHPGDRIAVVAAEGAPEGVEGAAGGARRFVLTRVQHDLDRLGFRSELSSQPPEPAPLGSAVAVVPAVVTRVNDPADRGRVRVRYPSYGDPESDWLAVMAPAAGRDKGLIALPERDDQVLVLLPNGDPAQGVVLGGLFGEHAPPDPGVRGESVERYTLRTRTGQQLQLSDAGSARLSTHLGNELRLADDGVRLHAETDLVIEAPGRRIVIRADTIDFERA